MDIEEKIKAYEILESTLDKFEHFKRSVLEKMEEIFKREYPTNPLPSFMDENSLLQKKSGTLVMKELATFCPSSFRDTANSCSQVLEKTFDQYKGIRQISDFRSIPSMKDQLAKVVPQLDKLLKGFCSLALELILSGSAEPLTRMNELSDFTLKEYSLFKKSLLNQQKLTSSLVETTNDNETLNFSIVKKFILEILEICNNFTENCVSSYNEKIKNLEALPVQTQMQVLVDFGGKATLGKHSQKF